MSDNFYRVLAFALPITLILWLLALMAWAVLY